MKYRLFYLGGCGEDYHCLNKELWEIQRQIREICNFTLQELYHFDYLDRIHYQETEEHLSVLEQTGYKRIDGYIYDRLKHRYSNMSTSFLNDAIQKAWKKYKDVKIPVLKGEMSIPSYRSDQPIPVNKKKISFLRTPEEGMTVSITAFSQKYQKETGYGNLRFQVRAYDGTQKSILERVESGEYAYGQCQLKFEKKSWYLYLTYVMPQKLQEDLDYNKILGVDMGCAYAVYASSQGHYGSFYIRGNDVAEYADRLERLIRDRQERARFSGEGRCGHGTKTRVAPIYHSKDKLANFRDTKNHQYSKELVDYAVNNGYGVIQMEDLTGIKKSTEFPKKLQHWTYYDLQTKIKYKAEEYGIEVRLVSPGYTSQRCSNCGHIDRNNRLTQERFRCTACGFEANADHNASLNISLPNIEKIIAEARKNGANPEKTEDLG